MSRVLIVSTDVVGQNMAGPGIRAWELARTLGRTHAVRLAVPNESDRAADGFTLVPYVPRQPATLAAALAWAEVIVGQGFVFADHPELLAAPQPLAIDLYDPLILEALDLYAEWPLDQAQAHHRQYQQLTNVLLQRGDFFFCATAIQRDYWLGALTAAGRITPELARSSDRELRTLIDLVPSGIADVPPIAEQPALRGVHPAIPADACLALWAGGLWDWFDPELPIRAVAALQDECPKLRLCFFAGNRPGPPGTLIEASRPARRARALAETLGVLDRSVIFLDTWVPYDRRGDYLAEADAGISAHHPGIETHLAFRTRLLDYLWARLPLICTEGDSLGQTITSTGAGVTLESGDLQGWMAAFRRLAQDAAWRASCRAAAETLARQWTWAQVVRPLEAFCAAPRRTAPDVLPLEAVQPESQLRQHVALLESEIERKNRHIIGLEHLLTQIEHGRVLRLLRWIQRLIGR